MTTEGIKAPDAPSGAGQAMTTEAIKIAEGPSVVLNRITTIITYEVMGTDLEALDAIVSRENQSLGFMTAMGGLAIPTIVSAMVADALTPRALAVYASVGGLAVLATLWFLITWLRVRKERPKLLAKIRATGKPG